MSREYQMVGEPIVGIVACQECFALLVGGDRPWHDEWHDRMAERSAAPLRRLAALAASLDFGDDA